VQTKKNEDYVGMVHWALPRVLGQKVQHISSYKGLCPLANPAKEATKRGKSILDARFTLSSKIF
jgi:hypothetical protein